MMSVIEPTYYLAEIKSKLATHPVVMSVVIVEEYASSDRGYFRARLTLKNGDFLEVAEYFVIEHQRCISKRYRYQWMDASQSVLKKRWDNVEHFPDLPNFPHHVHIGSESHIEPGHALTIVELIDLLESELNC